MSGLHFEHDGGPDLEILKRFDNLWSKRSEILISVSDAAKNDNRYLVLRKILLKRKVAVYGNKDVKLGFGEFHQRSILDPRPTALGSGFYLVAS